MKRELPFDVNNPAEMEQMAAKLVEKMEKEGLTLREALGVESTLMEDIYALAYANYEQGKYKESVSLFEFLVRIEPTEYKYALGLAASYHQLADYENAIQGFYLAWNMNPEDATPIYYLGDSLLKQGNKEGAKEFFEIAIDLLEETKQNDEMKERCKLLLKSLK